MELHEFLRSRRSVRRFTRDDISDAALDRILTTATHAPSAHNRQPWRFCVVKNAAAKSRLADAMAGEFRRDLELDSLPAAEVELRVQRSLNRIKAAPILVVLCMDMSEMDVYPDARRQEAERLMAIQSVAGAGLQLLLAAHAEGLAGVWTCGPLFAPETVRHALGLSSAWEPQAMFFLGQPDQSPGTKPLKPLDQVVRIL